MALRLTNAQEILSPDNYNDIDLMTYAGRRNKKTPQPYVAAVFTPSAVVGDIFILGDGRITDDPASRTKNDCFNGPLEPGTNYRIFQRIIINKKVGSRQVMLKTHQNKITLNIIQILKQAITKSHGSFFNI